LIDGVTDEILMDNVQYNTEDLLTQFDYGNNLTATFTYDSRDRLSTLDIKDGAVFCLDLDYTYDNTSNITQLTNGWRDTSFDWHTDTELYSYDGLDRLTSASCTSWSHTYSYDKVGNRTAKDSVTYTINTVNEVTTLSDGTTFSYDDNGNRTQKTKGLDTWMYTYDHANRLTKVEKNSTTEGEYVYDGDGKRIQATENVTTVYIYSGLKTVYEENTTGSACYIYGPTGTIAKRTTIDQETQTYYYHTDHLGSTRLVTDDSKTIVTAVTYEPFGEVYSEEGFKDYLFTGKEMDSTGLYYFGARYYDPEIGRFLTRDPRKGVIQNPQSLNQYTYCFNNPLKYIDPLGLAATFADEEAQNAYEEQTGGGDNENGGIPGSSPTKEPDKLYIDLPDGTRITLDDYGQSGNMVVGYGYMTDPSGDFAEQDQYFFVIVLDDEGNVENYDYWSDEELTDFVGREELAWKKIAEEFKKIAGEENTQNLANALDRLRNKIFDNLLNTKLEIAAGFIPYAGSFISAIGDVEQNKLLKRYHFISNVLVYGGLLDVKPL
jgi:RHS repeat-associated protein